MSQKTPHFIIIDQNNEYWLWIADTGQALVSDTYNVSHGLYLELKNTFLVGKFVYNNHLKVNFCPFDRKAFFKINFKIVIMKFLLDTVYILFIEILYTYFKILFQTNLV